MNKKRFCAVCDCEINIKKERLNTNSAGDNNFIYTSEDGVYFEEGKTWFCCSCYSIMLKGVDFEKIKNDIFKD